MTTYNANTTHICELYNRDPVQLFRLLYICKWHGINHRSIPRLMKEWVTNKYSDVKIINSLSMMVNKKC